MRALVASGCAVLLGAVLSAWRSDTPVETFAYVSAGCVAVLAIPFTIAAVVHLRAARRNRDDGDR